MWKNWQHCLYTLTQKKLAFCFLALPAGLPQISPESLKSALPVPLEALLWATASCMDPSCARRNWCHRCVWKSRRPNSNKDFGWSQIREVDAADPSPTYPLDKLLCLLFWCHRCVWKSRCCGPISNLHLGQASLPAILATNTRSTAFRSLAGNCKDSFFNCDCWATASASSGQQVREVDAIGFAQNTWRSSSFTSD